MPDMITVVFQASVGGYKAGDRVEFSYPKPEVDQWIDAGYAVEVDSDEPTETEETTQEAAGAPEGDSPPLGSPQPSGGPETAQEGAPGGDQPSAPRPAKRAAKRA